MSGKQTNYTLLKKIKKLSTGDISSKIKAVDMAIANFRILPQSFSLIKELANKTQPSEVRIRVAMKMREAPLKVKEHYELMKILFQNADKELLEYLRLLNMSSLISYKLLRDINPAKTINDVVQLQSKFLRDINPAKTINDAIQQQMRLFKDINPSKTINDAIQQQMRLFRDITRIELSNYLQSPRWSLLTNDYIKTAKPYVSFLDVNKKLTLPFRNQLNKSVGYYSKEELEPIKTPPQVRRDSKASTLLAELEQCEQGKKHWKRYQDISKEILCYCLVPPLQEPLEQSETRDGRILNILVM